MDVAEEGATPDDVDDGWNDDAEYGCFEDAENIGCLDDDVW